MIAVNQGDSAEVINRYVKDVGVTFRIGMNGAGAQDLGIPAKYGVTGYPTSFVVDAAGKVVWRGVPSDPSAIRAALEKLELR